MIVNNEPSMKIGYGTRVKSIEMMIIVSNALVAGFMKLGMTADDRRTASMSVKFKVGFLVAFGLLLRSAHGTLAEDVRDRMGRLFCVLRRKTGNGLPYLQL